MCAVAGYEIRFGGGYLIRGSRVSGALCVFYGAVNTFGDSVGIAMHVQAGSEIRESMY